MAGLVEKMSAIVCSNVCLCVSECTPTISVIQFHNVVLSSCRSWKCCCRPLTGFPHISTSVCIPERTDSIPAINTFQRSVELRRAENSFERRRVVSYMSNGLCRVPHTRAVCVSRLWFSLPSFGTFSTHVTCDEHSILPSGESVILLLLYLALVQVPHVPSIENNNN